MTEPAKQRQKITATFIYFGLSFIQENFTLSDTIEVVGLEGGEHIVTEKKNWLRLKGAILAEIMSLNKVCFGGKDKDSREATSCKLWSANGDFFKWNNSERYIFLYLHPFQATFSSLFSSQWMKLGISIPYGSFNFEQCCIHNHHDVLQPYFMDNPALKAYYEKVLEGLKQCPDADDKRQQFLESAIDKLSNLSSLKDLAESPYVILGSNKDHSWDYTENTWTKRLAACLQGNYFGPKYQVKYTAEGRALQGRDVGVNVDLSVYPFKGTPDILIHKSAIVMGQNKEMEDTTDTESSSADEAIEASLQRNPMKSSKHPTYNMPEKMGELLGCLHFLLVSKMMRRITKNRKEDEPCRIRGLLLDKIAGGVQCELVGTMGSLDNHEIVTVENVIASRTILSSESLCIMLNQLVHASPS